MPSHPSWKGQNHGCPGHAIPEEEVALEQDVSRLSHGRTEAQASSPLAQVSGRGTTLLRESAPPGTQATHCDRCLSDQTS